MDYCCCCCCNHCYVHVAAAPLGKFQCFRVRPRFETMWTTAVSLWAQALTVLSGSSGLGWVGFPPSPSPVRSGFCGPVVCAMAYALTLMTHSLLLVQIQLFYYTFGSWFFLHDATSSEIEAAYAVGGLPPVRNSAAMVSKCEKTICKSLTVWPLWWLAWIAGKAGAWSTVWRHLGRLQSFRQQSCFCVCDKVCGLHPLAVNERASFYKSGQVASTPILCRHTSATCSIRKFCTLGLHVCAKVCGLHPLAVHERARFCKRGQVASTPILCRYTSATCSTRKFCTLGLQVCAKVCGFHPLAEQTCACCCKSGQVASTPILCRHISTTCSSRMLYILGLHTRSVCSELPLCVIAEPTRSQVRAAQQHLCRQLYEWLRWR